MDKFLYIAASGAKQDLLATGVRANNLANAQTVGFKAQLEQARSMAAFGEGQPTRVFNMTESPSNNYEGGATIVTDRELDARIEGNGWFSVMTEQGEEAYTRAGSFNTRADGALIDAKGNILMGQNGPIFLPIPVTNVSIGVDGTIAGRLQGAPEFEIEELGQLKLVNPDYQQMQRREDGLFELQNGQLADQDPNVVVKTGMLEGSNVNAVNEMVSMISLQRHYEIQVKLMKKADELASRGNMLLRII